MPDWAIFAAIVLFVFVPLGIWWQADLNGGKRK